jgi:uncharacterized membrane protein HdeD (DUF308 family)
MKKYTISQLVPLLAVPALTVILGLVLLFSPDTASALVGRLVAWGCILGCVFFGFGAFYGVPTRRGSRILWAVICLAAGIWMLNHPLTVARFLSRVLGFALVLQGARSIGDNIRNTGKQIVISQSLILGGVTMVIGAVLVFLPMASSRIIFSILGVLLIGIGIAQGVDNIRGRNLLEAGDNPKIIDVEKV